MIGWKKVYIYEKDGYWTRKVAILKLDVTGLVVEPVNPALVVDRLNQARYVLKYRTDRLKVLAAFQTHSTRPSVLQPGEYFAAMIYKYSSYRYSLGKVQRPTRRLVKNVNNSCASGLHFFAKRAHAEDWHL